MRPFSSASSVVSQCHRPLSTVRSCSACCKTGSSATIDLLHLLANVLSGSNTYETPPDIPAAKLRPVTPSTTTVPPVMYSQPWSPQPSTTATAPELRTAKRSPATPWKYASPAMAPYSTVLPTMMLRPGSRSTCDGCFTTTRPPDKLLPT